MKNLLKINHILVLCIFFGSFLPKNVLANQNKAIFDCLIKTSRSQINHTNLEELSPANWGFQYNLLNKNKVTLIEVTPPETSKKFIPARDKKWKQKYTKKQRKKIKNQAKKLQKQIDEFRDTYKDFDINNPLVNITSQDVAKHDQLLKTTTKMLNELGIKTKLVETYIKASEEPLLKFYKNIHITGTTRDAPFDIRLYLKTLKKLNGDQLTISYIENTISAGFLRQWDDVTRLDIGIFAPEISSNIYNVSGRHELRHLMNQNSSTPFIRDMFFKAGNKTDLYGIAASSNFFKKLAYAKYIFTDELYTNTTDLFTLSRQLRQMTNKNRIIATINRYIPLIGEVEKITYNINAVTKRFLKDISLNNIKVDYADSTTKGLFIYNSIGEHMPLNLSKKELKFIQRGNIALLKPKQRKAFQKFIKETLNIYKEIKDPKELKKHYLNYIVQTKALKILQDLEKFTNKHLTLIDQLKDTLGLTPFKSKKDKGKKTINIARVKELLMLLKRNVVSPDL